MAAYYLAKKFEPEVRAVILDEFNKNLAVPVDVEDINLSLIQRFPYASLRFSNVVIPQVVDGEQMPDTLLFAKDLYLQIGLLDFLKQDYTVSEAELNQGFFDMALFEDGANNYHFWKEDTSATAGFAITNVLIKDFEYHLATASALDIRLRIEDGSASGDFGEAKYDIQSESKLQIVSVVQDRDTLYKGQIIDGDLTLDINHNASIYDFSGDNLEISGQEYVIAGRFAPKSDAQWDVNMTADDASVSDIITLVPIQTRQKLSKYKARGNSNVDLYILAGQDFDLRLNFDELKGSFQNHEALGTAEINEASGLFTLHNGTTALQVDQLNASIGPGQIKAKGKIENFNAPQVDASLLGDIDLKELKRLFNIDAMEQLTGRVILDGHLNCQVGASGKNQSLDFLKSIDFDGVIEVVDGTMQMKNQNQVYDHITGELTLSDNAVQIKSASARVNESPFEISGSIQNVLPYISQDGQKASVKAKFEAVELDFNEILKSKATSTDTTYFFKLPQDVSLDLEIEIEKISFRQFEAEQISAKAIFNNGQLSLNPIKFHAASGNIISNMLVKETAKPDRFEFESRSKLDGLKLNELFYAFENFDQEVILSENVDGTANAQMFVAFEFGQNLKTESTSIESEIDLQVIDGKLKNVKALEDIGSYLRESALYRTAIDLDKLDRKLKLIEFDTLSNQITIHNEEVSIPKMKITSSALTLNASGIHSFQNQIDYAINFRLSDILRKGKVDENEFGNVIDDETGLRIFLKMYGTTAHPQFSMDKESARAKRNNQFQEEKKTFKSILKEEFGLFKKDTTLTKTHIPKKQGETQFTVEWGDTLSNKKDSIPPSVQKQKPVEKDENEDLYDDDDL